jgi:hypothetical protein
MLRQHYHVVVIGAGPSGIAAAICSSRNGCRTLLLEKNKFPGGLVALGKISTICGLYKNSTMSSPEFLYDGFPFEFATKVMKHDSLAEPVKMGRVYVLHCRPGTFQTIAMNFLEAKNNLDVQYEAEISGIKLDGKHIRQIELSGCGKEYCIHVDAVIDSTGDAVICAMAGASVLLPDELNQVPAIMFSLENIGDAFSTRSSTIKILMKIKRAVDSGDLPQGAENVSFHPEIGGESVTVKLNLGSLICKGQDRHEIDESSQLLVKKLIGFLQENINPLASIRLCGQPSPVLHRASRRVKGMYLLTGEDVIKGSQFPDAIAQGSWPIEKYHFDKGSRFSYLPEDAAYDIPAGCLRVPGVENLFTAGRCISADDDAIASARVIGCCFATGEGAANLASQTVSLN